MIVHITEKGRITRCSTNKCQYSLKDHFRSKEEASKVLNYRKTYKRANTLKTKNFRITIKEKQIIRKSARESESIDDFIKTGTLIEHIISKRIHFSITDELTHHEKKELARQTIQVFKELYSHDKNLKNVVKGLSKRRVNEILDFFPNEIKLNNNLGSLNFKKISSKSDYIYEEWLTRTVDDTKPKGEYYILEDLEQTKLRVFKNVKNGTLIFQAGVKPKLHKSVKVANNFEIAGKLINKPIYQYLVPVTTKAITYSSSPDKNLENSIITKELIKRLTQESKIMIELEKELYNFFSEGKLYDNGVVYTKGIPLQFADDSEIGEFLSESIKLLFYPEYIKFADSTSVFEFYHCILGFWLRLSYKGLLKESTR